MGCLGEAFQSDKGQWGMLMLCTGQRVFTSSVSPLFFWQRGVVKIAEVWRKMRLGKEQELERTVAVYRYFMGALRLIFGWWNWKTEAQRGPGGSRDGVTEQGISWQAPLNLDPTVEKVQLKISCCNQTGV